MANRFSRAFRSLAGRGIGKASSSCRTVTEIVSASFSRRLTLRERLRVRMHLLVCTACRNYLSNLKMMGDVLGEPLLDTDPDDGLSEEARRRILEDLKK